MPPDNDDFANAIDLGFGSGSWGPVTMDDATAETGESSLPSGGTPYKSVWFKFVAERTGTNNATLDTIGSLAGDADSGDGNDPPGGFGNLDTILTVWRGTSWGGLTFVTSNDDAVGSGAYYSAKTFSVTAGETYYVRVSTWGEDYIGTYALNWTLPNEAPTEHQLSGCPSYVAYRSRGDWSFGDAPGHIDMYTPAYNEGDLLVAYVIGDDSTTSKVPPGFTELGTVTLVDAHGYGESPDDMPTWNPDAQCSVSYMIADHDEASTEFLCTVDFEGDYGTGDIPPPYSNGGGNVYRFTLFQTDLTDEGEHQIDFPDPPMAWCGSNEYGDTIYPNEDPTAYQAITFPPASAPYPGNHVILTSVFVHANEIDAESDGDGRPSEWASFSSYLIDPTGFGLGPGSGNIFPWDGAKGLTYSNKSIFTSEPADLWHWTDYVLGDGALSGYAGSFREPRGTLDDVPFYKYIPQMATWTAVVLSEETTRPINDDFADAYEVECGQQIVQCTHMATRESGEPEISDDGKVGGNSVWFKFTPTTTETVPIYTTGSNFDTMLGVYTGSSLGGLTEVVSNGDESGFLETSRVELDAVAGTTYYIKVAGWAGVADDEFGDFGILRLTIDCPGSELQVVYLGYDARLMT